MLDRIDRVQVLVKSRHQATETFARLFDAEVASEDRSQYLAANRTTLAIGESELELIEPDGAGASQAMLASRGEGLITAGVSTSDMDGFKARLESLHTDYIEEAGQLYIKADRGYGVPFVVSPTKPRERVGLLSFLYEVTNTLVSDWRDAAKWYAGLFGLSPERFSYIKHDRFGYEGSLTLFNPPGQLDRIELSQVTDENSTMGRWVQSRGDSLYMCYAETHDLPEIINRLNSDGDRWTSRVPNKEDERNGLWTHPKDLHGLLLGVSRTTYAWTWSGREELVVPVK